MEQGGYMTETEHLNSGDENNRNENNGNENNGNGNNRDENNENENNRDENNENEINRNLNNVNLNDNLNINLYYISEEEQEEEVVNETNTIKLRKTPLEYLEAVLGIAAGIFLFFADFPDKFLYFYFIAVMLFLASKNILSLWNKAIMRGTIKTFRFNIYFYLRTLVGIIIVISAYDICLTKHYNSSAYWIIFYSITLLFIIGSMDDVIENYRSKKGSGKTKAIVTSIMYSLFYMLLFGAFFYMVAPTLYSKERSIVIENMDMPTVDFIIAEKEHDITVYNREQTGMQKEESLLLERELNGKKLKQLYWTEMLNYYKMNKLNRPYYKIYFSNLISSDCILYQGMTYININGEQVFLVVDMAGKSLPWYRSKTRIYELKLSKETRNMLENYLKQLKE